MLDPVVGEGSSWISTTAVFREIKAREIRCHSWYMKMKVWPPEDLETLRTSNLLLWYLFFYPSSSLLPQYILRGQYIMKSLEIGCICCLSHVVRNIMEHEAAVTAYQSKGCMSGCGVSFHVYQLQDLIFWAAFRQKVRLCVSWSISHRTCTFLSYSWGLFEILCKKAVLNI